MARTPKDLTPIEAFLAPLSRLGQRQPEIEAEVYWESNGWPEVPLEELEAEEMAFYAEGLLEESFQLDWRILALADGRPGLVQIFVWEGTATPPPEPAAGLPVLERGRWLQGRAV
jgi:hypothetical protein